MTFSKGSELVFSRITFSVSGQLIYMLGQLGVLAILSQMRGAEATGMFGMALALVTPMFILANMGLRTVQALDQYETFSFSEYASFRLLTSFSAFIFCALIAIFVVSDRTVGMIILIYTVSKFCESFSELAYGAFERQERFDLVFSSLCYRSILTLFLFVSMLYSGFPLWGAFFAQFIVWALVAFLIDVPRAINVSNTANFRFTFSDLRKFLQIFRTAIPIGGTNFLSGAQLGVLRLLVEAKLGLGALGIFTNISQIFQAGAMVSNAIRQFLAARLSALKMRGDFRSTLIVIATVSGFLIISASLAVMIGIRFGDTLLLYTFGAETAERSDLLVIILIGLSFRVLSAVPMGCLYAYGGTTGQFWRELLFAASVVGMAGYLIEKFGLVGACWVIVIVALLRLCGDTLLLFVKFRLPRFPIN